MYKGDGSRCMADKTKYLFEYHGPAVMILSQNVTWNPKIIFKDTTLYLRLDEKIWGPDDSQSGMRRWTRQLQWNQRVAVLLGRGQSICVMRYVGFVITTIVESTWWMLMAWCPFNIVPYATVMITGALVACMWCPVWQTDSLQWNLSITTT